jgi:hypothetical protein
MDEDERRVVDFLRPPVVFFLLPVVLRADRPRVLMREVDFRVVLLRLFTVLPRVPRFARVPRVAIEGWKKK